MVQFGFEQVVVWRVRVGQIHEIHCGEIDMCPMCARKPHRVSTVGRNVFDTLPQRSSGLAEARRR
jgi:hypothetical protein